MFLISLIISPRAEVLHTSFEVRWSICMRFHWCDSYVEDVYCQFIKNATLLFFPLIMSTGSSFSNCCVSWGKRNPFFFVIIDSVSILTS